ncbi:MAG: protein-L-isoaspartate(D-aspartate) O-methyltransferase [Thermoleophilia bacterium]
MGDHITRRARMVSEQIAARGVRDTDVLDAMRSVPRHLFVPSEFESRAYMDSPLSIGYGQTISQPYMVALMTELLQVNVRSRVLEVGAGSGYQTAVLAELAGEVYAIERLAQLEERARRALGVLHYNNVRMAIGDGTRGWLERAPFDGILVAAAADKAPPPLLEQLAEGGRMVIPLGAAGREQTLTVFAREGAKITRQASVECRFVPLLSGEDVVAGGPAARERRAAPDTDANGEQEGDAVKCVRARVYGRVQRVYYRASARAEGERLGLNGWVRNCADGSVELQMQGREQAVDAMLDWCSVGPPAAEVQRVEVDAVDPDDTLAGFGVRQ